MAATVSSPWAKPGAWALDAEEHEAELQQQQEQSSEVSDFPSLATAAATKPKKKKGQTLSLAEFNSASSKPREPANQGLTHEDLLVLPTGPRQRSAEELDRTRLGGGFKNYGSNNRYNNSNSFGGGEDSAGGRWGSSRVSNREPSRESQPSRADEIDNWAAAKKPITSVRERGGGFFDSQSKADETDSWVSNKPETRSRFGFGSGFERKSSFDSLSRDRERDRDSWGRKREESNESERPRPRLVLQPRSVPLNEGAGAGNGAKPKGVNPFGEARPREQVLAEKGMDPKEIDEKLEAVKIREEKTDTPSLGRRGSGNGRGGFNENRSWRKNDSDSFEASRQSAEKTENGDAEETVENGHAEENIENGHVEEN